MEMAEVQPTCPAHVMEFLEFALPISDHHSDEKTRKRPREDVVLTPARFLQLGVSIYDLVSTPPSANLRGILAAEECSELMPPAMLAPPPSASVTNQKDAQQQPLFDYHIAISKLQELKKRSFGQCTSCFTKEQHEAFRPLAIQRAESNATPEALRRELDGALTRAFGPGRLPIDAIFEIVEREQTLFLRKWQETAVACSLCNLQRHKGNQEVAAHHCINANFLPKELTAEELRAVETKLTEAVRRKLPQKRAVGGPLASDFKVELNISAAESAKYGTVEIPKQGKIIGSSKAGQSVPVSNSSAVASFPPGHRVVLFPHRVAHGDVAHALSVITQARRPSDVSVDTGSSGPVICEMSFSTLVTIATCHLSTSRDELRIPLSCDSAASCPRIQFDEALPNKSIIARSELLQKLFEDAVTRDEGLLFAKRQRRDVTIQTEIPAHVSGGTSVSLRLTSDVFTAPCGDEDNGSWASERLWIPMVKLEYGQKGYNVTLDDPMSETSLLSAFSKKELITMYLALQLHPQAHVHVHRVNAYTGTVVAVESYTLTTFSSNLWKKDVECGSAWSVVCQALRHVAVSVPKCTAHSQITLFKAAKSRDLHVTTSPKVLGSQGEEEPSVVVEPASNAVAKREYLPPTSWPYSTRIPFTFPPLTTDTPVINRTQGVYEAQAYRDHDVWTHESRKYTVMGAGSATVVRQR